MKSRPSVDKRRKELQRQQKKKDKAARREERQRHGSTPLDVPQGGPRLTSTGGVDLSAVMQNSKFPKLESLVSGDSEESGS